VRPGYVLGGRAMEIVSDEAQLDVYMARAVDASTVGRAHPILIDPFLAGATEVGADCVADFGRDRAGRSRNTSRLKASSHQPLATRATELPARPVVRGAAAFPLAGSDIEFSWELPIGRGDPAETQPERPRSLPVAARRLAPFCAPRQVRR